MTTKRFETIIDDGFEISLRDNLTKDYPFSINCENIDEFEPLLSEVMNCSARMNLLWEQTLRVEKHNQELQSQLAQLIEQHNKNNELLLSDIRILEKALWCPNCTNNLKRLKELRKEFKG